MTSLARPQKRKRVLLGCRPRYARIVCLAKGAHMTDQKRRLDELAQKHLQEGLTSQADTDRPTEDAANTTPTRWAPSTIRETGSRGYLAGDRMPREKKPVVFDHMRAWGPWMVSVNATPWRSRRYESDRDTQQWLCIRQRSEACFERLRRTARPHAR